MYQKEIFANYELDNSKWKSALLTLVGGSLVLHAIIFLSAVYVPSINDAFYIAAILSGASSRTYIDEEYLRTEIEDATIINLSDERLEYPEGYFALANGDALPPTLNELITQPTPEIVSLNNNLPSNYFPPLPIEVPSPTPFPTPSYIPPLPQVNLPSSSSSLPKLPKPKRGAKVQPLPSVDSTEPAATPEATPKKEEIAKTETEKKTEPTNPADGLQINKKPLEDFGKTIKEQVAKKQIDINADFAVAMSGEFDKSGKIQKLVVDPKSKKGDEKLIEVAKNMLAAVNESGWLKLLEQMYEGGNSKVVFNVSQDKDKVLFTIQSERENEQKANSLSSVLGLALIGGKFKVKGPDEMAILENTSVQTNGKQVIISLNMPRAVASEMINRKLNEVKPEAAQPANSNSGSNAQAIN